MHGVVVLHMSILEPLPNLTSSSVTCIVANVISCRQNDVSLCPGSGVFKTFAGNVPFRAIIGARKITSSMHFLQSVRATKTFYAIIAILHAFLVHVHEYLLGPSGGAETFRLGFANLPRGPADGNVIERHVWSLYWYLSMLLVTNFCFKKGKFTWDTSIRTELSMADSSTRPRCQGPSINILRKDHGLYL